MEEEADQYSVRSENLSPLRAPGSGDRYDALGRVIREGWRLGQTDGTWRDLYYSAGWQVIKEDETKPVNGQQTTTHTRDNVWSLSYVDDMIFSEGLDWGAGSNWRRTYPLSDAQHNVTSLLRQDGQGAWQVAERYLYTPYGLFTVLDGVIGPDGSATTDWSADGDGQSDYAWRYLHQGGRWTGEDRMYHFRRRTLDPISGRWNTVDPLGYVNGLNLQEYVGSNPVSRLDPSGEIVFLPFLFLGLAVAGTATVVAGSEMMNASYEDQIRAMNRGENNGWFTAGTRLVEGGSTAAMIGMAGFGAPASGSVLGGLTGLSPVLGTAVGLGALSYGLYGTGQAVGELSRNWGQLDWFQRINGVAGIAGPWAAGGLTSRASATAFRWGYANAAAVSVPRTFQLPTSSVSAPRSAGAISTATREAAQAAQVQNGRAYLGWITREGRVGLVEATPQLPGHVEAAARGLIPEGSRGFSLVVTKQGEVLVNPLSRLNMDLPNCKLPADMVDAVKTGLKTGG